jgi:drug/metabolite transporter (DMT)-like permease
MFGTGTGRGIASMVLGMAAFVVNDTLTKIASETVPLGQLIATRNVMATALILFLIWMSGQAGQLCRAVNRAVVTRSSFDIVATFFFLIALFNMPIGNVMAINMATPLAMTAAAAMLLKAPVGWRRWSAVLAGFVGILLIVQPSGEGFNAYALAAVASVIFIVGRDLSTRNIDQSIPSLVVTLTNAVFILVSALILTVFQGWVAMGWREIALLAGAGLFLVAGYLLIVDAFRHGDLVTVGPFRYTGLVWALLSGFIIWGDIPNPLAQAGIAIVVASGLYVLHRERIRARDAKLATASLPK